MIMILPSAVSAMESDRFVEMESRIDNWLCSELPTWSNNREDVRRRDLHEIVQDGRANGMSVETDFALYALLMLIPGVNWRDIREQPQVAEALVLPDVTAPTKLMWLEGWLAERGHRIWEA